MANHRILSIGIFIGCIGVSCALLASQPITSATTASGSGSSQSAVACGIKSIQKSQKSLAGSKRKRSEADNSLKDKFDFAEQLEKLLQGGLDPNTYYPQDTVPGMRATMLHNLVENADKYLDDTQQSLLRYEQLKNCAKALILKGADLTLKPTVFKGDNVPRMIKLKIAFHRESMAQNQQAIMRVYRQSKKNSNAGKECQEKSKHASQCIKRLVDLQKTLIEAHENYLTIRSSLLPITIRSIEILQDIDPLKELIIEYANGKEKTYEEIENL